MQEKVIYLTREGMAKLEAEIKHLRENVYPEISERIRASKEFADMDDNSEYEDAKRELAMVEARVMTIENMLAHATLIEHETNGSGIIELGSRVKVTDDEGDEAEYVIVGSAEASPRDGKISNESPLGQALLGRKVGEAVEVSAPGGQITYKIVSVS